VFSHHHLIGVRHDRYDVLTSGRELDGAAEDD